MGFYRKICFGGGGEPKVKVILTFVYKRIRPNWQLCYHLGKVLDTTIAVKKRYGGQQGFWVRPLHWGQGWYWGWCNLRGLRTHWDSNLSGLSLV